MPLRPNVTDNCNLKCQISSTETKVENVKGTTECAISKVLIISYIIGLNTCDSNFSSILRKISLISNNFMQDVKSELRM